MKLDEKYIQPTLVCPKCRIKRLHVIDRHSVNVICGNVYADYVCFTCGFEHYVLMGATVNVLAQFHAQ
jgi:DNA-directed RNA polymerase subunit RPC12/RpoP